MSRREEDWTRKDMSVLREGDSAWEQRTSVRGVLKDYSMNHVVELEWDLNEEAIRDKIFRFKIGDTEALIDAEELQRLVRWV